MSVSEVKIKMVRLGEYLEEIDERNSDGNYTLDDVRGISVTKKLISTNANMQDVSLTPYKLLKPNEFAYVEDTSRRGDKIAIAINDSDETYLVSSVYKVFKCKDVKELHPKFLFLFINRNEFDRYSRFNSWGSARETFNWDELCNIQIPLPHIDLQQELVETYDSLKSLAEQNEALIEPLTKACQAYIVNCKKAYPEVELGDYIDELDERNSNAKYTINDVRGISILKELIPTKADMKDVSLSPYKLLKPNNFAYVTVTSRNGGKVSLAINNSDETYIVSSSYIVFKSKDVRELHPKFLFLLFIRDEFDRYSRFNSWGSARETFDWDELCRVRIPLPPPEVQQAIVKLYNCAEEAKKIACDAREKMKTLCPALVQKAISA